MPLTKEVKEKAIQLLREQGPENLAKGQYIRMESLGGVVCFCAAGAIGIATGMVPNKDVFYSHAIVERADISQIELHNLIVINDTEGLDAVIAYIETLGE